ncbi:MAG TPA: hypothetical protein VEZ11_00350 [Thermoanaerobaculia bacterium]|nr:hypothetical protein [Thermoanaerobaculia bacterium]
MRSVSVRRGVALFALLAVLMVFPAVRAKGAEIQPPIGAPTPPPPTSDPGAMIGPPTGAPEAASSLWEQLLLGIQLWAKIGPLIG